MSCQCDFCSDDQKNSSKKHRIEDLGRLHALLEDILICDVFINKPWRRPKDAWDSFCELDEDQKIEVYKMIAYGLERLQEKISDCLSIAKGDEE